MKKINSVAAFLVAIFLTACGTTQQTPILLNKQLFSSPGNRVGLYFETEQATTHIYGASCLLCYGVASAANSSLSSHFEQVSLDDINSLKGFAIEHLKAQGKDVKLVDLKSKIKKLPKYKRKEGFPNRDYRKLKEKHDIDTLVVIHIPEHGAYRSYSAYIATSDPMGAVMGAVYTVDLNSNQYIQYDSLDLKVNVSGSWDEPPSFPGVTTAYYEALEKTKEKIKTLF